MFAWSKMAKYFSWMATKKEADKEADTSVSPFIRQEVAEDGVRLKSKPIKTEQGSKSASKVKAKVIPKSAVERELIEASVKGNFVFAELSPHQLDSMVLCFANYNSYPS